MKMTYHGSAPTVDNTGFDFRVDSAQHTHDSVLLHMDFAPNLPPTYELLPIPAYTPSGWVFKGLVAGYDKLVAEYEPIRESIDPRDEEPKGIELRIYLVKIAKQEYVEDER